MGELGSRLFVTLAGSIGIGKSTLATALSEALNLPLYLEKVEGNKYLEEFYEDMEKNGFKLQMHLLKERFKMQQAISYRELGAVQDRSIYEDRIFVEVLRQSGILTESEYEVYMDWFRTLGITMARPTMILYLDASPEVCMQRIRKRGRKMEADITMEYLVLLKEQYDKQMSHLASFLPVMRVPWDSFRRTEDVVKDVQEFIQKLERGRNLNSAE